MAVAQVAPGRTLYTGPDVARFMSAKFGGSGFAVPLGTSVLGFSKPTASHRKAPDVRPAPKAQVEPSLSMAAIYAARREGARHA